MSCTDKEKLDNLLVEHLSKVNPPEREIGKINPWRRPILQIIWGIILTVFSINIPPLPWEYIIPTVGIILLYVGFRSLRQVNRWFRLAWFLALAGAIVQIAYLGLAATPLGSLEPWRTIFGIIVFCLRLFLLLAFRQGLGLVLAVSPPKPQGDPLLWAIIWYVVIMLWGLISLSIGLIGLVILVASLAFIAVALYRVCDSLEEAGYRLVNASVRANTGVTVAVYLLACLLTAALCCVPGQHLSLAAQPVSSAAQPSVRAELQEQGFPGAIVQDLADADLAFLAGQEYIGRETYYFDFASHQEVRQGGTLALKPQEPHLQVDLISAQGQGGVLYTLVYLAWSGDSAPWQDGYTIENTGSVRQVSGQLLYQKNGVSYCSPAPRLLADNVET